MELYIGLAIDDGMQYDLEMWRHALRETEVAGHTDWRDYYLSLYDEQRNPDGFAAVRASVARLAAYCRAQGIALYFVSYPELREVADYPFAAVENRLRALATEQNMPYFSLLSAVSAEQPARLWVTPPDPHPGAIAHELSAQAQFDYLSPRLRGQGPQPASGQTKAAP